MAIKYTQADYIQYHDFEPMPQCFWRSSHLASGISTYLHQWQRVVRMLSIQSSGRCIKNYAMTVLRCGSHQSKKSCDAQLSGTPDYLISTKSALGKNGVRQPDYRCR